MGRKITDFSGSVTAPGGAYPYGDIIDGSSGTKVNRLSNADVIQFFQRCAGLSGLTLNSLPDNSTNGWQYVQAVNTLWQRCLNGLATPVGATNTTTPVNISGMAITGSLTYTLAAGVCLYNGQLVFCPGNTCTPAGGTSLYISVATVDGINIGTLTNATTGTANSSSMFAVSTMINTNWQGVTNYQSGWGDYTGNPLMYRRTLWGTVEFKGGVMYTGGSVSSTIFQLPSSAYYPTSEWKGILYAASPSVDTQVIGAVLTTGFFDIGQMSNITGTTGGYFFASPVSYSAI